MSLHRMRSSCPTSCPMRRSQRGLGRTSGGRRDAAAGRRASRSCFSPAPLSCVCMPCGQDLSRRHSGMLTHHPAPRPHAGHHPQPLGVDRLRVHLGHLRVAWTRRGDRGAAAPKPELQHGLAHDVPRVIGVGSASGWGRKTDAWSKKCGDTGLSLWPHDCSPTIEPLGRTARVASMSLEPTNCFRSHPS